MKKLYKFFFGKHKPSEKYLYSIWYHPLKTNITITTPASSNNIVTTPKNRNPAIAFMTAVFVVITSTSFAQEVCPLPINIQQMQQGATMLSVPLLNSYPSSKKVLLLDMNGRKVTSKSWGFTDMIFAPPDISIETAIAIYERVKEDMILWDLNVTTDTAVYNAALPTNRVRIIITPTADWYMANAGGVALNGSFTFGDDTPCFVFSNRLGNNDKYIGECCSHEGGHTLGLSHQSRWVDGVRTEIYNSGTGTPGTHTSWAPIMGVGYYNNNTTWANGLTSANTMQDDISIIEKPLNGLLRRPATADIVRPNLATSQTFTLTKNSLVTILAKSGGNADLKIKINGVESNILDSLDCRIVNITLPAGTHTLVVTPVANINNPTGYSNFGQVFTSYEITPLNIVAIDTTTRAVRSRLADFRFTNERIYFKASSYAEYALITMGGQVVKKGNYKAGRNEIPIHNLPSGMYILVTQFNNYKLKK